MSKIKKFICIETFPFSPHLETSVEIACDLKREKKNVSFFWAGYNLPWSDWELPLYKKIFGMSYEYKIQKIEQLLKEKKINCIPPFELQISTNKEIKKWVKKFKLRSNLQNFRYKSANLGLGVKSSLISIFKNEKYNNNIELLRKSLTSSAIIHERTTTIIKNYKPDVLITFNNRFSISRPIIEVANNFNIPVWRHERGSNFKKYEIFKNKNVHDLDERSKRIYSHWNCSKERKNYIGKKYFLDNILGKRIDYTGLKFVNRKDKKIEVPCDNKIYTFFCSTDYEYKAVSVDYKNFLKNKKWLKHENAIKSAVDAIKKIPNSILYIKDHPCYLSGESFNPWKKFEKKNKIIYFDRKENVDSFDLLRKSDVILTYGSSMAVDAIYNGKPSISFRKHFFSGSNLLLEPKNEKELLEMMKNPKIPKKNYKKKCIPFGYYMQTFGKRFRFYKPKNYYKGDLFFQNINHYGYLINSIYKIIKFF